MKLYTEEQVAKAVMFGRWGGTTKKDYQEFLNKLTPIELPSDKEIEKEGEWLDNPLERINWKEGAKWMREQILNQNK